MIPMPVEINIGIIIVIFVFLWFILTIYDVMRAKGKRR